jgi:hypothetical protein
MGYSNFISMASEKWLFGDTITSTSIRKAYDIKKRMGTITTVFTFVWQNEFYGNA